MRWILAVANRSKRRGRGRGRGRWLLFLLLLLVRLLLLARRLLARRLDDVDDVSRGLGKRQMASLNDFHHQGLFLIVVDEGKVDLAEWRRLDGTVIMEVNVAVAAEPSVHRRAFHRLDRRLRIQFWLQALD